MPETGRDPVRRLDHQWDQLILTNRLDRWIDHADCRDALPVTIENGRGDAGNAAEEFLSIQRISKLTDGSELLMQLRKRINGVWCEFGQFDGGEKRMRLFGGEVRKQRLAGRGCVEEGLPVPLRP